MLNKLMKLKNKKGFTLVELIVVIAIIAILTAIIVPLVGRYSAQATYTTLQDAAQTISNNTNTVISDVTMMGTVFNTTPITGTKTNGNLEVDVGDESYSGPADGTTVEEELAASGLSTDAKVAMKLYSALQNALPNQCYFRVEVATNTVSGVIYSTAGDVTGVETSETSITSVDGFESAYEMTLSSGESGAGTVIQIGLSGSYKPTTETE